MWRKLRGLVLLVALVSLVAIGPLQYAFASAEAMPAPCPSGVMDEGTPEPAPDDKPAKACSLLQCRVTPPGVERLAGGSTRGVEVWHPHRFGALRDHAIMAAAQSPELRPPIA